MLWALVGCGETPKNSKKKALSQETTDPDALYSGEVIGEDGDTSNFGGTAGKTTAAVAAAAKPTWAMPGSPQTTVQPKAPAEEPVAPHGVAPGAATATTAKSSAKDDRRWGIILLTFSGEDHFALAEAACAQLRQRYPLLKNAFARARSNGSVVMVGRFTGPTDLAAKPLVKEVQALVDGNDRPFARSFLSRVEAARAGSTGAFDLRRAREANPEARSLFSLEVAVWSDFGSGEISLEEIRKQAEAYTKRLRAQGFLAFYNHDDDRRMSIVTIGLFGANAYDAKTMLYSDEVDALKKKFPKLLVNGEELRRQIQKGSQETTPEGSLLVEVPR